jgi:hypothetical protein
MLQTWFQLFLNLTKDKRLISNHITLPHEVVLWLVTAIQTIRNQYLKKIICNMYNCTINRKLRVATKIGSTFFWLLTIYRAAEIVQNDNLSSAWNFRSIEYHHALYLNFGTLAGLWPWVIWSKLKIEILGFFHHHHEISDP